jgi:hypothetical protein
LQVDSLAPDRRLFLALALIAVALATPARAHEIGTTQVHALFRKDHTFAIDVFTAPQALLNKIEAQKHLPRSSKLSPVQLQQRLQSLAPQLAGAASIRFGGETAVPSVEVQQIVAPADPRQASYVVVRFRGDIPPRASDFTWQYALTYAAYALTLQNEGHGAPSHQWLEGDQRSAPFPLARDILPPTRFEVMKQYLKLGFTHIVPHGLDHILFVLGIFLLTTRIRAILTQVTVATPPLPIRLCSRTMAHAIACCRPATRRSERSSTRNLTVNPIPLLPAMTPPAFRTTKMA